MKKQVLLIALFVGAVTLSMTSCKYRGQCECDFGPVDVSTEEQEFDSKHDYDEAKDNCEDAGCNWQVL